MHHGIEPFKGRGGNRLGIGIPIDLGHTGSGRSPYEACDLLATRGQQRNDSRTDKAGRSGNENVHGFFLSTGRMSDIYSITP
jgi:hypothetical protein